LPARVGDREVIKRRRGVDGDELRQASVTASLLWSVRTGRLTVNRLHLPDYLECELNLPLRFGGSINLTRTANGNSILIKEGAVVYWRLKFGQVEEIEKLRAELNVE